jgi:hypothetical protein
MAAGDFSIGYFGDLRRCLAGGKLFEAIVQKGDLHVRVLSSSRAEQVRFERFLTNDEVTIDEIKQSALSKTASTALGVEHVLAIQDTSEFDFNKRREDIEGLGVLKARDVVGFYAHPALAISARDDFVLGLAGCQFFEYEPGRPKAVRAAQQKKMIEEKDSYRWLACAEEAKTTLAGARMVTLISDRESDIYEYFSRIPDKKNHLLVRARLDRQVSIDGSSLTVPMSNFVEGLEVVDRREIFVPGQAAKVLAGKLKKQAGRQERLTTLELRYSQIFIHKPAIAGKPKDEAKTVRLTLVDVREVLPDEFQLADGEEPIHWRLLTTHAVTSIQEAWQIVEWYKKRWHIEQLFRSAKRGGMRLEDIALSDGDAIKKLAFLGLLASIRILQLTLCRDGTIERAAAAAFSPTELEVLHRIVPRLEGKTVKQKNQFKSETMAWAYWAIARLGGWKGYTASEGPAGPKTLKRGLDQLAAMVQGWELSLNVCTS